MTAPAPDIADILGGRVHRRFATRAEWLAARGVGGSEVAAIRGRSPFRGPWDVWCDRQPGIERREDGEPEVIAEGHRFEPFILQEYAVATGRETLPAPHFVVHHPDVPWATGSLDGFALDPEAGWGAVEVKTYRMREATWARSGTVIERYGPEAEAAAAPYYLDQAYWYLEVTGLPWLDFAVWLPRSWGFPELRWIRVLPDRAYQSRMLVEVARWRARHLLGDGPPPEVDGSDGCRRWLDSRPTPARKVVREATEREAELVALLLYHREQRDRAEEALRAVESELHASMVADPANAVRIRGGKCSRVRSASGFHFRFHSYEEN